MYCYKCGKELPVESLFCPYCGEKQKANASHNTKHVLEEKSIQSTQSDDKKKANSIANEIIANLKMIGLAILMCGVFIGVFYVYHIKDRKPVSENHWGYSCYDCPFTNGYYEMIWENIFSDLQKRRTEDEKDFYDVFGTHNYEEITNNPEYGDLFNHMYPYVGKSDEYLTNKSKEIADKNRKDFEYEINSTRTMLAKEDLEDHIKYGLIVSLAIMILGRYLIKGIKWVVHNKS